MDSAQIIFERLPAAQRTMRIAVVTETYPPEINGVAMTVGRMVTWLRKRQHQVQLVRPRQGAQDNPVSAANFQEVLQPGLPIPRYDSLKMGLPAGRTLIRLWTSNRPDIVHIVTEGPLGWSALSAAGKLKIPVSTDFHTNFHSYSRHYGIGWLERPITAYLRGFHNKARCTLVPTGALRNELEERGYANLKVVARGVDTALFHPRARSAQLRQAWGAGPDDPVVIYVGRIAPEKNIPVLLRTFDEMRVSRPSAKLVLVGDGPQCSTLQARCPQHVFAGMRTGEDLAAHYASGDIFLFPSITETFGNVTMEAMASGLAVVAYDYAAAAEHIRHNHNGLVADFDDASEFAGLAVNLINDPSRIADFGTRARQTAEELDWENIFEGLETVLAEILTDRDSGHVQAELSAGAN